MSEGHAASFSMRLNGRYVFRKRVLSFGSGTSAALECPTKAPTSSAAHFLQERHSMLQPPVCVDDDLTISITRGTTRLSPGEALSVADRPPRGGPGRMLV